MPRLLPLPLLLSLLALLQPRPSDAQHAATEEASFWLEEELRQWWAAGLACQRAGGHLAVPRSREAALQLAAALVAAAATDPRVTWAYVGYTDLAERGEFLSVTGVELWASGYERWHTWNMRGGPDDHCLVLDRFGLYWDVPCNWTLPALCERAPAPPTPCPVYEDPDGPVEDVETVQETTTVSPQNRMNGYALETRPMRWAAALAHCQRLGKRLALPRSSDDAVQLRSLLLTETLTHGSPDAALAPSDAPVAFIGVSDLARAGVFVDLLGDEFEPPDAAGWNASATATVPGGGRSCVVVDENAQYRAEPCEQEQAFVCEAVPGAAEEPCPPTPPPPTEAADVPPPPGRIVLEWREPRHWNDSQRHCLLKGGILATAQTRGEARAMAAMLLNVPRPSDAELGVNIWAFVGARDNNQEGNFTNIFHAELPPEGAAAGWGPGQPNGDDQQNCLALDRAALLWDVPCGWSLAFFCRRLPLPPPWASDYQGGLTNHRWAQRTIDALADSNAPDPEFEGVDFQKWAGKLHREALAKPRAEPNEP